MKIYENHPWQKKMFIPSTKTDFLIILESLCRTNQQLWKSKSLSANLETLSTICIFHATGETCRGYKLAYLPFGPAGMRWKRRRLTNKTSASGKSNVQLTAISVRRFSLLKDGLLNLHEFTGFVTAATEWCALHEALIAKKYLGNPYIPSGKSRFKISP